jgi:hypothetical protein
MRFKRGINLTLVCAEGGSRRLDSNDPHVIAAVKYLCDATPLLCDGEAMLRSMSDIGIGALHVATANTPQELYLAPWRRDYCPPQGNVEMTFKEFVERHCPNSIT